ncbi:uncharacterized protein LOC131932991 [Physella acuta]|uniref:uncharacterized protein LOC131932991 n=1 Tax=Physella acuta TaxID=109671 RepID=UPI0027DBAD7B|nr:uncharacterized protein LOC131932991 [Physella acuta]
MYSTLTMALPRPIIMLKVNLMTMLKQCRTFSSLGSYVVDLRSDTLTKPTPQMREAMKNAVVGDDVFGEDPTVNKFQEMCASVLGKEEALLMPTCTMANTSSVLVHCSGRFSEVILGEDSHIHKYEVAALAQLAGIQGKCVPNLPDGSMDIQDIEACIRPIDDVHQPWTKVICLENTHNRCGGKVLSLDYIKQVKDLAQQHSLLLHLDGARLFNAATALNIPVSDICKNADSVSVAFSKGLCCPLGSAVAGSKDFIAMARRARKALGGGMRQAGVIAAPMIVALETMVDRLSEDHSRAYRLAQGIEEMAGNPICNVDLKGVQSNIVMINLLGKVTPVQFSERLKMVTEEERKSLKQGISVLMLPFSRTQVRYVTHNDVKDEDIERAIKKLQYVIETL